MKIVAAVFPFQNVWDGVNWLLGTALRQQVSILVLIPKKTFGRSVALDERQVAYHPETYFMPGSEEFVSLVPAVKTDAKAIPAEHAINFMESGPDPTAVVVIGNAAPVAG